MPKQNLPQPPSPWWQILSGLTILIGLALFIVTLWARGAQIQTQNVVETTKTYSSAARLAGGNHNAIPDSESTKSTLTSSGLSDTVIVAFVTIAAVVVVAGAFYTRVTKITIGSNVVELAPTPKQVNEAADAVSRLVKDKPELANLPPEKRAALVYQVAYEIARVSAAAQDQPADVVKQVADVAAPEDLEIAALKQGSVPTQYWDRVAREALKKQTP
jgi:hypothetical protein